MRLSGSKYYRSPERQNELSKTIRVGFLPTHENPAGAPVHPQPGGHGDYGKMYDGLVLDPGHLVQLSDHFFGGLSSELTRARRGKHLIQRSSGSHRNHEPSVLRSAGGRAGTGGE